MGRVRYTETFKVEAVRQVTEGGYGVYDVASRLGISNKSLYDWIKVYGPDSKTTGSAPVLRTVARVFVPTSHIVVTPHPSRF
jgi:transposase